MDVLGLLFPKRCVGCRSFGAYLCSSCFSQIEFSSGSVCAVCSRPSFNNKTHPVCGSRYTVNGVFASVVYKGIIKKLLYQFKFKPYLTDLQESIYELLYEGLIQQELFSRIEKKNAIFVPVPLFPGKERKRGYNHAKLLADRLGSAFSLPVMPLLLRHRQTLPQYGLSQKARKENVKDAFVLVEEYQRGLTNKTVFLVDDIVTSGATMQEAAKVLKRAGAEEVWGLAFAHGQ